MLVVLRGNEDERLCFSRSALPNSRSSEDDRELGHARNMMLPGPSVPTSRD